MSYAYDYNQKYLLYLQVLNYCPQQSNDNYLHPLFVHPELRDFIREQLKGVNWGVHPNKKWQESHQRQWKKVLTDPGNYYKGPGGMPQDGQGK